jgi:hypothetical protein
MDLSDPIRATRAFEGAGVVYLGAASRYSQWQALLPRQCAERSRAHG